MEYTETYKTNPAYLICVSKEKGYETGFAVYVSTNGTDYKYQGTFKTFATAGTIVNDYPDTTYDIDDEVGVIFKPYKEFKTYDNISRDRLFVEPRVLIIDDEIMAFQNYDPYGDTDYHITGIIRGIHWSGKAYHNAGAEAFIVEVANNVIQLGYTSTFYMKIVPVFADRIGRLEDATAIEINPTLKARKPLKPERVTATRISDTDARIDVFVKTKVYLTGAGKVSADSYTDTYPFEYEGQIVAKINDEEEVTYDKPNFVISDRSESYNLTVKAKWNGYISEGITITVPAGGSWFDPSEWQYKRQITVTEQSGNDLTDYQVLIELNSSNFDFSHANSDGSDIRFYDGGNLYPYWIEKWDSSNQEAKIWVKVPSIPASSSTSFYMYYGNPDVASVSNGEDTFEFFDDFDTADYTIIRGNSSQVSVSDSKLRIDATSGYSSLDDIIVELNKEVSISDNFRTEGKIYLEKPDEWIGWIIETSGQGYACGWYGWAGSEGSIERWDGWNNQVLLEQEISHYVASQGSTQILRWDYINGTLKLWDTDLSSVIATHSDTTYNSFSKVAIRCYKNSIWQVDWILVRKYTDPEPSVSVGDEETS